LKKAEESAVGLARERYILQRDVRPIVDEARQHWDALLRMGTASR
jgi:hypothetical protein